MASQLGDVDDLLQLARQIQELHKAGKLADAVSLAERLVKVVEASDRTESLEVAGVLIELAELLIAFDRAAEAELLLQRALDSLVRQPGGQDAMRERFSHIDTSRLVQSVPALRSLLADVRRRGIRMFSLDPMGAEWPRTQLPDQVVEVESYGGEEEEEEEAQSAPKRLRKTAKRNPLAPTPPPASRVPPVTPASAPGSVEAKGKRAVLAQKLASRVSKPESAAASIDLAALQSASSPHRPEPPTPQGALEIEAGRLAYQIPNRMWVGARETVEVRLGAVIANEIVQGFVGRGDVRLEDVHVVETMKVSLVCLPGAFDIEPRSEEVQLVKPDLVKGTAFHQNDFARWMWLVTPRQRGKHTLFVKVSAAIRDSRGLPTTSSLPDKIIAVTVRVDLVRAATSAFWRTAPGLAWAVATTLVGIFTKDYWWPVVRSWLGM